jgi:hypothetical protein
MSRSDALLLGCLAALAAGCSQAPTPDSGVPDAGMRRVTVTADSVDTRFVTREHFLAGGEMQISGEPFAEAMGRSLNGYSRDHLPADLYFDPSPMAAGAWVDLTGFSMAVESYEYSKQPMNMVAFESGAGTSLAYGPLVNPGLDGGTVATSRLAAQVQHFAQLSDAAGRFVFPPGTFPAGNPSGDLNPHGSGQSWENPLGWPGIWPTVHVFRSFDPAVAPTSDVALACAITSDDDPGATGALACADYECDATTLHLPNRDTQLERVITPGADGFTGWKYGLWVLNYLQVMHDSTEAAVGSVAQSDLSAVGAPGNVIVGAAPDTMEATAPGTFLGSSDIEGFQAALFIDELDNRAEDWLLHLTTADGTTLSGFASLNDALAYDYAGPLRWFPGAVAVTESDDGSGFPRPAYSLSSAGSDALDLFGLSLAYSEMLAITDTSNGDVGGSQPARAYFDGDPFPADNQLADGELTLHDRALAVLRVALVNLDRLHTDPASGVLVDQVTFSGATPSRGTTASTTNVAEALLALRTARRALSSQLELYSNNTPDTAVGTTPLDTLPIHHPSGASVSFSARLTAMLNAEADLLYTHLTDASGRAFAGWDVSAQAPTSMDDTLDAHTAAVRGLFAAYLATGDVKYRDRALAVFDRIESVFYDAEARLYGATPAPVDSVTFTPLRFALLQSALRDVYELVAARPGGEALELKLEERVGRLHKLVLNGWDDRNGNRLVEWPDECVNVQQSLPRGGLQMAERTLTGEIGSFQEAMLPGVVRTVTSDREHDCVPEIDDARLPAALAGSITFHVARE